MQIRTVHLREGNTDPFLSFDDSFITIPANDFYLPCCKEVDSLCDPVA